MDEQWFEEFSDEITTYVSKLLDDGHSKQSIADILIQIGIYNGAAPILVDWVVAMRKGARRKDGLLKAIGGAVLATIGVAITVGTYHLAGPGGTFVVTGGLVVVGVFYALHGLFQVATNLATSPHHKLRGVDAG